MLGILSTIIRLFSWVLLVYCVMTFVMPDSDWTRKLGSFFDPLLNPFRKLQNKVLPSLRLDFSPVLLCLALRLVARILFG